MMYIRIADICFEIEREVELEKAFRKFRINRPKLRPDIKIKIAKGKPVKPKEKNLLLKSDGFWSIYVEGKKRIVIDSF